MLAFQYMGTADKNEFHNEIRRRINSNIDRYSAKYPSNHPVFFQIIKSNK
jgi:hypothetical protein